MPNDMTMPSFNFNRSIIVNSKDASLWNGRGRCLVDMKRWYEEGVSDLSKALELDGSVSQYWYICVPLTFISIRM